MNGQLSDREITQAVAERYGARARAALESAAVESDAAGECCAPDSGAPAPQALQFIDAGAGDAHASCGPDGCEIDGSAVDEAQNSARFGAALYSREELGEVPDAAQLAAAGCGNPVAIAELRPGETVLDLGSGGGIDCFLAAQQVSGNGEVWGLDMTPDMMQLARANAEKVGAQNVRFRLGEIEDIPFRDKQFDVVISNCVINLSPDKPQVFREAFRVLAPGGRLRVSDIVLTKELPEERRHDLEQWAGCVAGALPVEEYLGAIRDAGFIDVSAEYDDEGDRGIASAHVSALRPG